MPTSSASLSLLSVISLLSFFVVLLTNKFSYKIKNGAFILETSPCLAKVAEGTVSIFTASGKLYVNLAPLSSVESLTSQSRDKSSSAKA